MKDRFKQKNFENDIAIVGMACCFPGAKNATEFWNNLKNGKESISFFNDEELENGDEKLIKDPNFVKAGSVLEDAKSFDAQFFGFSEYDAKILDPQHRKFLECSWEALEDGGYDPYTFKGSIGVFAGSGFSTYLINNVHPNIGYHPNRTFLESMNELQLLTANDRDYLATRVAYKLNLRGPSINVQTACSTALVAIHLACQSIINGECDMALAGAVTVLCPQKTGYLYQQDMILSPDGHCRPFDSEARGTVFGSGVGVILLKKLSEAIRDKDAIYAVIKGTAVNNDGLNKIGYSAPSVDGQAAVIAEALAVADIEPRDLSFVECHGTATQLGDLIEITALKQVFNNSEKHSCAIGSVKSNIGHLGWASGMAGLFKTVLALKHRQIPPTIHFKNPNPQTQLDESPFYVNTKTIPWRTDSPRVAGVSAFGLGGTNAHLVVAEHPAHPFTDIKKEIVCLCTISARSEQVTKDLAKRYLNFLNDVKDINLSDFCYTTNIGRMHFENRVGFISSSISDLKKQLDGFLKCKSIDEYKKIRDKKEKLPDDKNTQELVSLLKAYESGGMPDWSALYANKNAHRVHLPTYPFQQQEYWLEPKQLPVSIQETEKIGENWLDHFYEVIYKEHPKYRNAPKYFPTAQHLKKVLNTKSSEVAISTNIGCYQDKLDKLDRLSYQFIVNAFYELGFTFDQKDIRTDDFVMKFNIAPRYKKLVRLFFEILEQEGVLSRDNDSWKVIDKPRTREISIQDNSNDLAEFELLNRCGLRLAKVLRGEVNPLDLIFPNGDVALLKKLYTKSPTLKAMNMLIAEALNQLQNSLPKRIGIRILEIGAGTGSTTTSILGKLSQDRSLYTFTDISGRFVSEAKDNFSDYSFISYAQFDVEKDAVSQKLETDKFDIIVATNVLHATKDLRKTIENIKKILAPSGMMILLEGTAPVRWVDITFGLTDGWWNFTDYDLRKNYPLLSPEQWKSTLKNLGFGEISILSSNDIGSSISLSGGLPQAIIFAKYTAEPDKTTAENVLVFADNSGVSDSLIAKLETNNKQCVVVKQGESFKEVVAGREYIVNTIKPEEFDILFDHIKQPIEKVLYLWSLNEKVDEASNTSTIKNQYLRTCGGLLNAVKSIVNRLSNPPALFVITQGVQMLDKQACPGALVQASIWGMCRVIEIEHPELFCKLIDIESEAQTESLLDEMFASDQESQIVLKEGTRYTLRLSHKKVDTFLKGNHSLQFRNDGAYVITGGFGGIGLKVAEWMSQVGAQHIVLVGRNSSIDDVTRTKVDLIRSKGVNVHVVQGDVSDYESLKKLFKDLNKTVQVRGIIHAAGAIDDGIILQQNIERFLTTACAKVLGSWNLHILSLEENLDLDFFVLFSSVVSTIGNVGQSNHASANSFMNSLVSYRKSLNLPATVIQWGAWSDIGTLVRYPEVVEKLRAIGINLIRPEDGIKALDLVLKNHVRSTIYAPVDWEQFIHSNKLNGDRFFSLLETNQHKLSQKERLTADDFISRIKYLSNTDKISFIQERVLQHINLFLGLKQTDGIKDEDFFDYGMDSLTSIQLRNNLQSEFKCSLHPAIIYKYSTVRKLSAYLAGVLQIDTSQPVTNNKTKKQISLSNTRQISMQQKRWLLLAKKNYGRLLIPIVFYTSLDKAIFRSALEQVILRHEVLRYKFFNDSAILVEMSDVLPSDRELFTDADNKEGAQIIIQQTDMLRSSPPDPNKRPTWTIKCIKLDQEMFLVLLHTQHLEFDGASVSIFVDDLRQIYSALIKDIDVTYLPSIQYSDYVKWQTNYINSDIVADREFFEKLFSGVSGPTLLPNHSGYKATESYPSACYTPKQIKNLWSNLQLVGKNIKVSPFAILCATYGQLISEITGQNQVVVGTIVSSRPSSEFDRTIGPFVQPFPLKLSIVDDLRKMMLDTHDLITEINDRSRYPVADMVNHITAFRGMDIDTYFTDPFIMLNNYPRESNIQPRVEVLESLGPIMKEELPDLTSETLNEIAGLFLIIDYYNGEMRFNFWYQSHRFTEIQVQNWAKRYLDCLLKNIRRL